MGEGRRRGREVKGYDVTQKWEEQKGETYFLVFEMISVELGSLFLPRNFQ